MSYPPPPGLPSKSASNPHPSLPSRPPPSSTPSYKPANNASFASTGGLPSGFASFAPRSVAASAPSYNAYPQPAYPQQTHAQQPFSGYGAAVQPEPYGPAPSIRNPFAPPSATAAGPAARAYEEDPEMAAQIAQWQSAYAGKDASASSSGYTGIVRRYPAGDSSGAGTSANAAPLGGGPGISSATMNSAAHCDTGVATVVNDAKTNTKTVVRSGGGSTWTDSSLLEWDPAHFRLFVGNLAGEVTDESLQKAFSKWSSVQKARVIRDKRTTKSKGYGFVSFSDGDDFFQAARDMQGKYIGSHPVLLRRSTTEIKAVNPKDKNRGKGGKGKGKGEKDKTGAGVQKGGQKTKGGLKVLG
ncbi:hypothetical protein PZA11_003258 [Diplocarpon coronariae]|uniref:RRM domain-containing protein n=1 Tax=Diplocarpon coronariae TaxID=2795749 RepID=A0A218ZDT0_9HELO|nr:hypothetical protein JHW43_006574 [Diplocarpon mali]OWP06241.1 hypothetical protein B2J93_4362 [Marssonina coronariae]